MIERGNFGYLAKICNKEEKDENCNYVMKIIEEGGGICGRRCYKKKCKTFFTTNLSKKSHLNKKL